MVAADFNGDGNTDLAFVIDSQVTSDPCLSILPGNGDGDLSTANTSAATAPSAVAVVVGDFYGNGIPAVVLLSGPYVTGSSITVLQDTAKLIQATPTITWAIPATINYGTPLSATQLNATATAPGTNPAVTIPGSFVYTPAVGAVLSTGNQKLSLTFTPTDTVDYLSPTRTVTLTVNPAPSYTLSANQTTVNGSFSVTLTLVSTNYAGAVSFATNITSNNGTASNVTASAPSVTLTNGGNGSSVLTITANANAANHAPKVPWNGNGMMVFGAVLLGAPFALRRKRAMAVLLASLAISLVGFSMACSGGASGTTTVANAARVYYVTATPTGTGTVTNPLPVTVAVVVQ